MMVEVPMKIHPRQSWKLQTHSSVGAWAQLKQGGCQETCLLSEQQQTKKRQTLCGEQFWRDLSFLAAPNRRSSSQGVLVWLIVCFRLVPQSRAQSKLPVPVPFQQFRRNNDEKSTNPYTSLQIKWWLRSPWKFTRGSPENCRPTALWELGHSLSKGAARRLACCQNSNRQRRDKLFVESNFGEISHSWLLQTEGHLHREFLYD